MKCALIIGHSSRSPGAAGNGISEFSFNSALAQRILALSQTTDMPAVELVYRADDDDPETNDFGYYQALPAKANATGADFAISLHCNAYNKKTSGCEALYWHTSGAGKAMAEEAARNFALALGNNNRGAKAITSSNRGALLLQKTTMPCIIGEPFFIDNARELANAQEKREELALAYCVVIEATGESI